MKRVCIALVCLTHILFSASFVYGEVYEKFQIKLGMHEKTVNDRYGMPVMAEDLKKGFLPISKKKALYKIDDSDYMILYFFSGRVKNVTLLENAEHDEAIRAFKEEGVL